MNIHELPAVEIGRRIAAREVSSREVTGYFLERARRLNERVNAYTFLPDDTVLEWAEKIDARLAAGEELSPLAGVPVAVKDVLCTDFAPTTCSSKMLANFRPPYNATVVQRLVDQGLIPVGKTNMDEFAMGASTETSAFGMTRNPWDLASTPGGSSGGAAAALAAGMTPLSIGTDTGGSVRQPSAFCGVCGLKPTYGRVSRFGLIAFASSLDQVGPMAHYVEDVAAFTQVLAGHDPQDSTSLNVPVPDYTAGLNKPLSGLRVGMVAEHVEHESLDGEIRSACERAKKALQEMGATVVDVHLEHTRYAVATYYLIAPSEASSNLARFEGAHYGYRSAVVGSDESPLQSTMVRSRSEGFGDEVKRRIMLGTFALSAGYADAFYKKSLKVRRLITQDYTQAFESVDVLLGPSTPTPAFKLGEKVDNPVQMYLCDLFTVGANLAGIPAMSVPAGKSSAGLPVAVQLQAPVLGESRLLNVAYQLQQAGFFKPSIALVV